MRLVGTSVLHPHAPSTRRTCAALSCGRNFQFQKVEDTLARAHVSWPALHTRCKSALPKPCPLYPQLQRLQHSVKRSGQCSTRSRWSGTVCALQLENRELLVGDCLSLTCFCLYKQITALILLPTFPGWLVPMAFNPVRFEEFIGFAITLTGTWVIVSLLLGGYRTNATTDLPSAVGKTALIWLLSQPIAAAQLVLVTAAEGGALVGDGAFASVLPLAASGPGEPLVTTAGVLGLMSVWRCFYTVYLDVWNMHTWRGGRVNRYQDMAAFVEALRASLFLSIAFCIIVQFLSSSVGEENLEAAINWLLQEFIPTLG